MVWEGSSSKPLLLPKLLLSHSWKCFPENNVSGQGDVERKRLGITHGGDVIHLQNNQGEEEMRGQQDSLILTSNQV